MTVHTLVRKLGIAPWLAAAALGAGAAAQSPAPRLATVATARLDAGAAAFAVDERADGAAIVVAGADGTVTILSLSAGGELTPQPGGPLRLPRPQHSVLALADVTADARRELLVLSDTGVHAYALDGAADAEPIVLTTSGRLGFRVGAPVFAPFAEDVNADGALDLVIPRGRDYELWLRAPGDGPPRFDLAQTLPVDFDHSARARADALSDQLRNRIRLPFLDIRDLNGDGRPDLRVTEGPRRMFFMQREDGRFADEPIEVDVSIFRDTTPKASVGLGDTLVASDRPQLQSGDLDGDGIVDHVVAHRRKVWSFLGTTEGPQFTDASVRMVAEDVTGMLLLHLDDDDRKDLVVFKVDVPSAGQLVLGLVSSIDVPVTVLGYRTDARGEFESRAAWRRELTLRAPSLLNLLSEAEDLVARFTEVVSKFRWSTVGDFDGDGATDVTLLGEDDRSAELWLRPPAGDRPERATETWLRGLLFENPDTVFDVDRLLELVAEVFDTRTSTMTGRRPPDATGTLPDRTGRFVVALLSADLDGDGRAELLLIDDDEQVPDQLGVTVLRWQFDG